MVRERRRHPRSSTKLSIKLILQNRTEGTLLAGPISGLLTNISLHGGHVQLNQIYVDNHHLFYSSKESKNMLCLEITLDEDQKLLVPIFPVWFDRASVGESETNLFKMGVEFIIDSENELAPKLKKIIQEIEIKKSGGGGRSFLAERLNFLFKRLIY